LFWQNEPPRDAKAGPFILAINYGFPIRHLFVSNFERMIPLKLPSNLHQSSMAARLFTLTEGHIGELSHLLVTAAAKAVVSGAEHVTMSVLETIEWVAPSDRKYQLDQTT